MLYFFLLSQNLLFLFDSFIHFHISLPIWYSINKLFTIFSPAVFSRQPHHCMKHVLTYSCEYFFRHFWLIYVVCFSNALSALFTFALWYLCLWSCLPKVFNKNRVFFKKLCVRTWIPMTAHRWINVYVFRKNERWSWGEGE